MDDSELLQRLAAAEAKIERILRWQMGAEVNFERVDGDIDCLDDSLTKRTRSMEDQQSA